MRGILWSDVVKRISLGLLAAAVAMVAIEAPLVAGLFDAGARNQRRDTVGRSRPAGRWRALAAGSPRIEVGRSRRQLEE